MLQPGDKICVFDEKKVELGEGTLIRIERLKELNMTAYECREHTILAKFPHYVRRGNELIKVLMDD